MENLDSVLEVKVSISDQTIAYWASKPWVSAALKESLATADVAVVPWENFRNEQEALFLENSSEYIRELRAGFADKKFEIAKILIDILRSRFILGHDVCQVSSASGLSCPCF